MYMVTQLLKGECAELEKEVRRKQHLLDLLDLIESMVRIRLDYAARYSKSNAFTGEADRRNPGAIV